MLFFNKKVLPNWSKSFGTQIVLALFLGIFLGIVAKNISATANQTSWLETSLSNVGSKYVSLLQVMVVPLVFTAVVSSIATLKKLKNAARLAGQTLLWFFLTAFVSVCVGLVIALLANPGKGSQGSENFVAAPSRQGSWWAFFEGVFPTNIFGLNANSRVSGVGEDLSINTSLHFNILQILVIAVVVGIAALQVGSKAELFIKFNESVLAIVHKVLWWIIRLAPFGTMALVGSAVASYGWDSLGRLGMFSASVYLGLLLVLFVVYPVFLKINGLGIKSYYFGVWPALQLAFVTRSSIGTMPLTQRLVEKNLGVPTNYAAFAVPLASTTKMDGCAAIYPAIASVFVAQFYGIDLGLTEYFLIVLVSVLGSAATAGTTGAIVMLTLTLSTLGLPLEGVGLLLAVDPIVDMGRTAVNVAGQALVPTIVAKREGILDEVQYNSKHPGISGIDEKVDVMTDLK